MILKEWPPVSPETALELLDCKYADMLVRRQAVFWLDRCLTDDKLNQVSLENPRRVSSRIIRKP